jgi:hypothetical protein
MEPTSFSRTLTDILIEARKVPHGSYQSVEEVTVDLILFAHEAGISPERLEHELLVLEGARNAVNLEKLSHLAGIAAFVLSAYQQFSADPKPADPSPTPHAVVAAMETARQEPGFGAYRAVTPEEAQLYFQRHRQRATGELPLRPEPLKKGPYADEARRGS